ncbi:Trafficking protein particle complex subunit 4 [Cichlidogyrus casuarinus]|uniref:Trafficking protein particle complex subunit n=1 Tax=Cichlidogyrus casuarinus TaxID=1844966 RepID=A0ABD2PSJ9_9PLAT
MIISASGSLVFEYTHNNLVQKVEKKFDYPVPLRFYVRDGYVDVEFGVIDEIKPGYRIYAINGIDAVGTNLRDGRNILNLINDPQNFPLSMVLGTSVPSSDLKISLASLFHTMHSLARNLTPKSLIHAQKGANLKPSGLQFISTKSHNFHCFESATGVKFVMITDYRIPPQNKESLRKIYDLYTNYVLKNPLIDINQPFTSKADFLIEDLKQICNQLERETKLQPLSA